MGQEAIDEYARALTSDRKIIEGMYVADNASAAAMGATIGTAMVFGYIAAMHIVKNK